MNVGDLVKMKWHPDGDNDLGIILAFELQEKWARVYWSENGLALEKIRDLEVPSG